MVAAFHRLDKRGEGERRGQGCPTLFGSGIRTESCQTSRKRSRCDQGLCRTGCGPRSRGFADRYAAGKNERQRHALYRRPSMPIRSSPVRQARGENIDRWRGPGVPEFPTSDWDEGGPCEVVGRVGALISMHQMNLSSYVVQERCIEIASHLHRYCWHQGRLRRLVVPYWLYQWRYGRCIEIAPHLHRYCWHQGRLRRPVVQYRFASWLWQMHRDRSHLHRHCRHQRRLRRPVVQYWFCQLAMVDA